MACTATGRRQHPLFRAAVACRPLIWHGQDPGEEVGQRLVPVQRQHVRDVLVRADDDHAAGRRGSTPRRSKMSPAFGSGQNTFS